MWGALQELKTKQNKNMKVVRLIIRLRETFIETEKSSGRPPCCYR